MAASAHQAQRPNLMTPDRFINIHPGLLDALASAHNLIDMEAPPSDLSFSPLSDDDSYKTYGDDHSIDAWHTNQTWNALPGYETSELGEKVKATENQEIFPVPLQFLFLQQWGGLDPGGGGQIHVTGTHFPRSIELASFRLELTAGFDQLGCGGDFINDQASMDRREHFSGSEANGPRGEKKITRKRKLAGDLTVEEQQWAREVNRAAAKHHRKTAKDKGLERRNHYNLLGDRNKLLQEEIRRMGAEVTTMRQLVVQMYQPA